MQPIHFGISISVTTRTPGSSSSERARRLDRALEDADVDHEKKAQRRAEMLARRKEMEKERRKAIRAAQARQKAAKMKKTGKVNVSFVRKCIYVNTCLQ